MLSTTGKANGLDMMFQDPKNQNYFPIGFHMSMAYYGSAVNGAGNANTSTTSTTPGGRTNGVNGNNNGGWANGPGTNTAWDLESGGLLNPWISFWVQPGAGGTPIGFGLVKLWVRFDDLLNTTWLNLYVGKTSVDMVSSNQRAMAIGTGAPFTMYDFQPGTPEVANNGGTSTYSFLNTVGLYTDGDIMNFLNDATAIRYFGYHINSGASCSTTKSFSIDPCETRVNVNFLPNSTLYSGSGFSGVGNGYNATGVDATNGGGGYPNNGFSFMTHVTQSFGGWGRTNGERIGAFALVGSGSALPASGTEAGGTSPASTYTRFGVDVMLNPLPNGNLNIVGAWEIVSDPTGMIEANNALMPAGTGAATSGLQYMTWFTEVNWQPTFGGFFSQSGTNSNLVEFIYNQLNMEQQPTFSGVAALPGNYDNVLAFTLLDRYWLWGSDRADISLFAQYQYMINYGVSGVLNNIATASGNFHGTNAGNGYFGNVEANNFSIGLDFAY